MAKTKLNVKAKKTIKKSSKVKAISQDKISFDYIKSKQFRVIRVDGAHGGIAPSGNAIQMALFSERQAIPTQETYQLKNGRLGKRIDRQGRDAIIREVEIETIIDLETAKKITNWLGDMITKAENLKKK